MDCTSNKFKVNMPIESNRVICAFNAGIKEINCMISWWSINLHNIHANPDVVSKCSRIIRQLENYRNEVCGKFVELKRSSIHAEYAYRHGPESDEFRDAVKRANKLRRELVRMSEAAGHYYQAMVTKWFYEDDYFTIIDVEVKDGRYDFDIEIADKCNNHYCVEVWQGQSKHHHVTREKASIVGIYDGIPHHDPGSVPDRFTDMASERGGVDMDSKHDLPKIWEKLEQLPDNCEGFLIACRNTANYTTMVCGIDFPTVPVDRLPRNKCIIVLIFGGDTDFGKRGTAFPLHHPDFESTEVARKVIRSLGFTYSQYAYNRKRQLFEQFDL